MGFSSFNFNVSGQGKVEFEYDYSDELGGHPRATTETLEYTVSRIPMTPVGSFPMGSFRARWSNAD